MYSHRLLSLRLVSFSVILQRTLRLQAPLSCVSMEDIIQRFSLDGSPLQKSLKPWRIIPIMPTNSGSRCNTPDCTQLTMWVGRERRGDLGQRWETGLRTPDGQRKAVCGLSGSCCWTLPTHIRQTTSHTGACISPHVSSHSPKSQHFSPNVSSSLRIPLRQCHGLRQLVLWTLHNMSRDQANIILPQ